VEKARQKMGWVAETNLVKGVDLTLAWWKKRADGLL
jgi:nucleoside-diphosphate-sugar epimerase